MSKAPVPPLIQNYIDNMLDKQVPIHVRANYAQTLDNIQATINDKLVSYRGETANGWLKK